LTTIEKAWLKTAGRADFVDCLTFSAGDLVLGVQTSIGVVEAEKRAASAGEALARDSRVAALLSAACLRPVPVRAVRHVERALHCQARGETVLAAMHLALAGGPRLDRSGDAPRRLFAASELMKRGVPPATIFGALDLDAEPLGELERLYNPDQPRTPAGNGIESGRWSAADAGSGAGLGSNTVTVGDKAAQDSLFSDGLSHFALRALGRLASRFAGPASYLRLIFVPDNSNSSVREGAVPGRPDLRYAWDKPAGALTVRIMIDGRWVTLTSGAWSAGGLYRDENGRAIARTVDGALAIDLDALDEARTGSRDGESEADADNGPRLCPAPTEENTAGRSPNTITYQSYVSGLPPGLEVLLRGVRFDGCRESDGTMLEAKGRYEQFLNDDGSWKSFFDPKSAVFDQMRTQSNTAAIEGRRVEWHVQEWRVAAALSKYAGNKFHNLRVIFDPWPPR
jgi:hypothetical protein